MHTESQIHNCCWLLPKHYYIYSASLQVLQNKINEIVLGANRIIDPASEKHRTLQSIRNCNISWPCKHCYNTHTKQVACLIHIKIKAGHLQIFVQPVNQAAYLLSLIHIQMCIRDRPPVQSKGKRKKVKTNQKSNEVNNSEIVSSCALFVFLFIPLRGDYF